MIKYTVYLISTTLKFWSVHILIYVNIISFSRKKIIGHASIWRLYCTINWHSICVSMYVRYIVLPDQGGCTLVVRHFSPIKYSNKLPTRGASHHFPTASIYICCTDSAHLYLIWSTCCQGISHFQLNTIVDSVSIKNIYRQHTNVRFCFKSCNVTKVRNCNDITSCRQQSCNKGVAQPTNPLIHQIYFVFIIKLWQ